MRCQTSFADVDPDALCGTSSPSVPLPVVSLPPVGGLVGRPIFLALSAKRCPFDVYDILMMLWGSAPT
jgi:hypothetical protein